jgi:putative ABC transport system ATP-binding protein
MNKKEDQISDISMSKKVKKLNPNLIINLENLKKTYITDNNETTVLHDINLQIEKGELIVILGPSGCGKTTLMNIMSGLINATSGSVKVCDVELTELSTNEKTKFRRENISFIFQQYGLVQNLNASENIELGLFLYLKNIKLNYKNDLLSLKLKLKENLIDKSEYTENYISLKEKYKSKKTNNHEEIDNLLKTMNLEKHGKKMITNLSGGQQQRVSIARALAKKPTIIFADEPTGALDESTSKIILEEFLNINKKFHTTIVIITHNPIIAKLANKIIYLKDGYIKKIIENEKPATVLELDWEI